MGTAAQLDRLAELDDAHAVAVLLAEEHYRSRRNGLLHRGVTTLLQRMVGADGLVHQTLHLAQLLGRHLLEVREVEAQSRGRHHRALLLDMRAQHLAQGLIQEVCGRMVIGRGLTLLTVDHGGERRRRILGQRGRDMHDESVLLLRRNHVYTLVGALDVARIADLTARIAVKRRAVEH